MEFEKYTFFFYNCLGEVLSINVDKDTTIEELINMYFMRKGKGNLIINNIENTYFLYNALKLEYKNNKKKISSIFRNQTNKIIVHRLE